MPLSVQQFRKIAVAAARCADQKKAEDIRLLDLRKCQNVSSDFVLVMSGNSRVHLQTLQQIIEETLDRSGLSPVHRDGSNSAMWRVLDYGGLIVHVFHEAHRSFYSVERLWENAVAIRWQEPLPKNKVRSKRATK